MDYVALKAELDEPTGHPVTGPYDADNAVAAGQLNAVNRTRNRSVMTGKEVKDRIAIAEWNARTDAQKQIILAMCNRDDLDPFGIDAQIFQDAMTGATATLAELNAYRVEDISRAVELGFGAVTAAHVDTARRTV